MAIKPTDHVVCSPADGEVAMIFPTGHAFGIKTKDDVEIMVHIGIETVNLNGKGFTKMVSLGDKVKKGTPIITFDSHYLSDSTLDMTTMVIITELNGKEYGKEAYGPVERKQLIMKEK